MKNFKNIIFPIVYTVLLSLGLVLLSSLKNPVIIKKGDPQDTLKKKQGALYSKKTIITFDEFGNPHEEILENFEGDDELRDMLTEDYQFDNNFPGFPPMPNFNVPHISDNLVFPSIPDVLFDMDSLDLSPLHFDFDSFGNFEEFETLVETQFEDFGPEFRAHIEQLHEELQDMDSKFDYRQEEIENLNDHLLQLNETMQNDLNLDRLHEELDYNFGNKLSWSDRMKDFEKEAKKELVKDGYLNSLDKIESISWSDDEIKFNEKIIKDEHVKKYRELREKIMNKDRYQGRPE